MKKFFSAFLLMTAMVLSVGTFVACNDLVDDVEDLKSQTTQNAADIAAIKTQIATLEQGIAAAKQAAADAKTFAEKCAAEAKAEALAAAKEYAESLNNATQAELATLKGMVEGIDARLSTLEGTVDEQAKAIAGLDEQIAALKKYAEEKVAEIVKELETMKANILANANNITSLQTDLKAVQEKIAEIDEALVTLEDLVYNVLKSIAYIPEKIDTLLNEIEDGFFSIMRCAPQDAGFEYVTSNCVTLTYRVNPANAEVAKEDLSFIAIGVETRAEDANVFEVVDAKRDGDRLAVTVKSKTNIPGDDKTGLSGNEAKLVALKVANDNYSIVSDYTAVADTDVHDYVIRNAKNDAEFFNVCWWDETTLAYVGNRYFYPTAFASASPVELVYSGSVDLSEYVETYCTKVKSVLDKKYDCVNVVYTFSLVDKYISPVDGVTDQQQFVVLNGSVLEVKPNNEIADAEDAKIVAVGKTPVVKVVASVDGLEIAKAYIKVDIVEEPAGPDPTVIPAISVDVNKGVAKKYVYDELYSYTVAPSTSTTPSTLPTPWDTKSADYMTWNDFTVNVLARNDIYMSNEQFIKVYDVENASRAAVYTSINGVVLDPETLISDGIGYDSNPYVDGETTTTWTGYYLNSKIQENCEGTVTITIPVKKDASLGFESNEYKYPEAIKLVYKFAVEHETVLPDLNTLYAADKLVTVKGHRTDDAGFVWSYEEYLHEAFEYTTYSNVCAPHHSELRFEADHAKAIIENRAPANTPLSDKWLYDVIKLDIDGGDGLETNILTDFINEDNYDAAGTLRTINDLVWDATGYLDVPVTLYTVLDNGNRCSKTYTVRFVNPFAVTLANATLETDSDGTTYDVLNDVVVTFDGKPVYENKNYTTLATELSLTLWSEYSIIGSTVNDNVAKGTNQFVYGGKDLWLHSTDAGLIYWNNGGTRLLEDVTCNATIYVKCPHIGWFTIAQPATVTLQKN